MPSNAETPAIFPAIAIIGPTAVGKTALSIQLARELGGEIINFDSMQIYIELNIGTAKPSRHERSQVPHHLFDIRHIDEPFDAAEFVSLAIRCATHVRRRGNIPIFVGGTGFYLKALERGLDPAPSRNPALRAYLDTIMARYGREFLWKSLNDISPELARITHLNDTYRLIRRLEIALSNSQDTPCNQVSSISLFKIGLARQREELYLRIDRRVDNMIASGLITEVKSVLKRGYGADLKPLQSIGYKQTVSMLKGETDQAEAISLIKRDTRRYAKRQLTWFKSDPSIRWFHPDRILESDNIWEAVNHTRNPKDLS